MSTSPPPAWSMTVGPSHLLMEPGHTARLAVTDIGTKPRAVTGSVVKVGEAGTRCVPAPGTVVGVTVSPEHMSIAPGRTGWASGWTSEPGRASPSAAANASHVRLYLAPYLGRVLLAELSASQVQGMFTAIARQHAAAGHPVTAATLTRVKAALRAALNAAVPAGYLVGNPAAHVQLPSARRPRAAVWTSDRIAAWEETGIRPPVAVWTAAQTAAFLNAIRGHRLYAAYHPDRAARPAQGQLPDRRRPADPAGPSPLPAG